MDLASLPPTHAAGGDFFAFPASTAMDLDVGGYSGDVDLLSYVGGSAAVIATMMPLAVLAMRCLLTPPGSVVGTAVRAA